MGQKLNLVLAATDHQRKVFSGAVSEYVGFFKSKQGAFLGEKKTYSPREGTIDVPSMRVYKAVVTTVPEKLNYFVENVSDFISNAFAVEATNASGVAKAKLMVEGVNFGEYSSLELLRLKSILEEIKPVYDNLPMRSDAEEWDKSTAAEYSDREVFESPKTSGVSKSTQKVSYILEDPNVANLKDGSKYQPQVAVQDTILELGDYTTQKFSGEYTQKQRAAILKRISLMIGAVQVAIKKCNEAESVKSDMTAEKLFSYLHQGQGDSIVAS